MKPTAADWDRLANLNRANAAAVAEMRARTDAGQRVKKGEALRLRERLKEADRLEKSLKKRAGIA